MLPESTGYANHGKTRGATFDQNNYSNKLSFIHHAKSIGPCLLLKSTSPDSQIRATLLIRRNYLTTITKPEFQGPVFIGRKYPSQQSPPWFSQKHKVRSKKTYTLEDEHGSPTAITHEKKGKWSSKPPWNYVPCVPSIHFTLQSIHLTRRFFLFVPSHITSLCSRQLWVGLLRAACF